MSRELVEFFDGPCSTYCRFKSLIKSVSRFCLRCLWRSFFNAFFGLIVERVSEAFSERSGGSLKPISNTFLMSQLRIPISKSYILPYCFVSFIIQHGQLHH